MKKVTLFFIFTFLFSTELVIGSGKLIIKKEDLASVSSLESNSVIDINIFKSNQNYYELKADDNIVDLVIIKIEDNKLYIQTKDSFRTKNKIVLDLYLQNIEDINIGGTSNLSLNKLNEEKLILNIDGSINIESDSSKVESFILKTDGTYNIDIKDLKISLANLNISGTGEISLFVEDNLKIKSNAVATIEYKGNPKIEKQLNFMTSLESDD